MTTELPAPRDVPDATVSRLPVYLRALAELASRGVRSISSQELAKAVGVRSTQLRKDLSHLGSYGVRGVGYEVAHLREVISARLGLTVTRPVVIVGMGNLGRALAGYSGFANRAFPVVALFDRDPEVVGTVVAGTPVSPMTQLARLSKELGVTIGVIATHPASSQEVADQLVDAGIRSILTFASAVLSVPEYVTVRVVDLGTELHVLAFRALNRRTEEPRESIS